MKEYIHISDLHINDDIEHNNKVHQNLIKLHNLYPDAYFISTGDNTNNGDEKEYTTLTNIFDFIKDKLIIVPGNHDYGVLGNFYQASHERNYHQFIDHKYTCHYINDDEKILIIGLDSNLRTIDPFDFACGEIGETQLIMLNDYLYAKKYTDYKKIVYLHHHPFMHTDPTMKLYDSNALMPLLAKHIDCLLFGHKHTQEMWHGEHRDSGAYMNYGINLIHCAGRISDQNKFMYIKIDNNVLEYKYIEI